MFIPESAWADAPTQLIRFELIEPRQGLQVRLALLRLGDIRQVGHVDLGADSILLYQGRGFLPNEDDGLTTWNWMAGDTATLRLPLDPEGADNIYARVMSADNNTLRLLVNGTLAGEAAVTGAPASMGGGA